jgi:AbrB family looped-hinge helix DNA binding protein
MLATLDSKGRVTLPKAIRDRLGLRPPGNHLETLKDDRKGQHSIRISDQWRVCFVWTVVGPTDVEIVDDH